MIIYSADQKKKMYAYNKIYLTESPCGKGVWWLAKGRYNDYSTKRQLEKELHW